MMKGERSFLDSRLTGPSNHHPSNRSTATGDYPPAIGSCKLRDLTENESLDTGSCNLAKA